MSDSWNLKGDLDLKNLSFGDPRSAFDVFSPELQCWRDEFSEIEDCYEGDEEELFWEEDSEEGEENLSD